jgi:tRNA(His) guanylyltransferase
VKFEDLDAKLRVFETAHDYCVLPGLFIVARLDGRSFTHLTKEVHAFKSPYDEQLRDYMVETVAHLMTCGFKVLYGYTQSDEISLLFDRDEQTFGRKLRKFNSVLAGEASAKFSVLLQDVACFDCRLSQLPRETDVIDYFRWRQADAHRNSLNAHCYWCLRQDGLDAIAATKRLSGLSVSAKNELLWHYGLNYNDLPTWQKRGVGLYWQEYDKQGRNPLTGETVTVKRRRINRDFELPMAEEYNTFIRDKMMSATEM